MIRKVLVANRGEIAVRVMRSCREMGILSVAVFSEADRKSMHVRYADEAYCVGPASSAESYLNIDKIIEVAKIAKADAIHPGYGFLSENANFADKVKKAGIIFIGPSIHAINTMGDKLTARELMIKSGVPVVPGTEENITDNNRLKEIANQIGYPVMIKASAGGGGKGMRLVRDEKDVVSAYEMAKSEASSAFGNDAVYIEKYIEGPHHIEFQIMADQHGNYVHLFERECSVQRRHQKVVEETPSPLMTPELRAEMGKRAIDAAKSVDYIGAGTVEFLVDNDLNFYFLEMNTRLQVEHPITERVTGIDLVKAQINVANGLPLPFKQEDLRQNGHAIECRIYAEDHKNNFMPSPGVVKSISEPLGLGVRTDGYVYEGYEIPFHYDPMISKLISWAPTRSEAIERMKRALYEYKIIGVKTSIPFVSKIMEAEDFVEGKYDTHFIEKNMDFLMTDDDCSDYCEDIALLVAYLDYTEKMKLDGEHTLDTKKQNSEWKEFARRRNVIRL
ncbi:acetyl-CoA carboxylase biotin carboxylase subunit [Carboxylicivirga linearis]|uniref:Acetyl-CoA carboxylase biotin carboxylase subunit n=1 Tax=Carboxylicivirga linearis TaxID=1628157 RepID=A0ABS5JRV8_9BACT|nr:acetyl-CoA carboxylase biotin carboxylase subunit [Carboxylicivirga linearis]MBS2097633.1 acetyl-CoA carboxylase biotin carboxylase subunit [Carboxylicivirga linearis]